MAREIRIHSRIQRPHNFSDKLLLVIVIACCFIPLFVVIASMITSPPAFLNIPQTDIARDTVPGDPAQTWYRTYADERIHWCSIVRGDGLFVYTLACGHQGTTIIKWTLDGTVTWNRTIGELNQTWYYNAMWLEKEHIYIAGSTNKSGCQYWDILLVKVASDGTIEWQKTWGTPSHDWVRELWGNGTCIFMLGEICNTSSGYPDIALVKWDLDGNQLWNRTFGGNKTDEGILGWCNGNELFTLANIYNVTTRQTGNLLSRWSHDGTMLWNRTIADGHLQAAWTDGSIIYTGGFHGTGFILAKWDILGNQVWNQTWHVTQNEVLNSLWSDGTFIYTFGDSRGYSTGGRDQFLVKWAMNGSRLWNRTWGGGKDEEGTSIWADVTSIYTCGQTASFGKKDGEMVLVKWDTSGRTIYPPEDNSFIFMVVLGWIAIGLVFLQVGIIAYLGIFLIHECFSKSSGAKKPRVALKKSKKSLGSSEQEMPYKQ